MSELCSVPEFRQRRLRDGTKVSDNETHSNSQESDSLLPVDQWSAGACSRFQRGSLLPRQEASLLQGKAAASRRTPYRVCVSCIAAGRRTMIASLKAAHFSPLPLAGEGPGVRAGAELPLSQPSLRASCPPPFGPPKGGAAGTSRLEAAPTALGFLGAASSRDRAAFGFVGAASSRDRAWPCPKGLEQAARRNGAGGESRCRRRTPTPAVTLGILPSALRARLRRFEIRSQRICPRRRGRENFFFGGGAAP